MSTDLAILGSHLSTLIEARSVSQHELDPLVAYAISETQDGRTPDTRRAQWEYLLKNEVFKLAATEGNGLKEPEPTYFDELKSKLDLVLAFTEHDVCDVSFPFSVLEDLLETQTVASCWRIFSWIEERTDRLTTNMIPAKGKSLVLLRTLNDLLRRLSKTGKNPMFCGRILNFLSNVFPLGERSGVNLRGDYGPQWEGVVRQTEAARHPSPGKTEDIKMADPAMEDTNGEVQASKSEEPAKPVLFEKPEEEKKDEFFQTFWSLQLPFSRPPLFSHTISFDFFKDSVNTVLPVIAEATKKERAMMGSKVVAGNLKRKRDPSPVDTADDAGHNYFFAKFLTSPELLDLEIADTLFRRQFLFQLLILLQHLLLFTQSEKAKWAVQRNRSLQMDFTLNPTDAKWAQDTWTKAMDELKATTPNGKAFADSVAIILEREQNWIKWKNETCPPFDKEPVQPPLEEQTGEKRRKLMEPSPAWRFRWGTEKLTEIWETGFQSLRDCENPPELAELKDFAKRIKQTDLKTELRKKQLTRFVPPSKTPRPGSPETVKPTSSLDSVSSQGSRPAPSQAAASVPTSSPATVPASGGPIAAPAPVAPTPVPAPPSGPASLHPSLPPRPVVSPAPSAKPQTPNRHLAPPSGPAATTPAVPKSVVLPPPPAKQQDYQLTKFAEQRDRLSWLAIRRARTEHLHLFGKIGTGDVDLLMTSIEQEKEKGKEVKGEKVDKLEPPSTGSLAGVAVAAPTDRSSSPATASAASGDAKLSDTEMKPALGEEVEPQRSQDAQPEDVNKMETDT